MVALLVVMLALFVLIVFELVQHSKNNTCNYNNPNKSYIKTTPNCVVNFMCTQGHTAFSDACGCGCAISQ